MTGVTVALNRSNYSLYETTDRATLIAAVGLAGASAGEVVTLTLQRDAPGGARTVLTEDILVTSGHVTAGGFTWTKDLRELADAQGVRIARISQKLRDYACVATPAAGTAATVLFTVTPITVEEMRFRWCMGLPLRSVEFMMPREQPKAVTGVTIISVGSGALPNTSQVLDFNRASPGPHQLKWAGGAYVDIPALGVARLVLTGAALTNYVVVEVTVSALPGADAQETIVLDYAPMTDDQILTAVFDSYGDVQTFLQVFLEPTYVASRAVVDAALMADKGGVASPVDVVGDPVAYYRPMSMMQWLAMRLPYNNIRAVLDLSGWFNQTRIVQFPRDLVVCTWKTGLIELIPTNQVVVSWGFYGVGYTYFMTYEHIANFWNYHVISGLAEVPVDILSFIAKRAAVTLLIQAGQAQNPSGLASKSLSRDGVSEGSALMPGGVYAATINQYLADTGRDAAGNENLLAQYRERYRGINMVTV